jgi:hypothetical protein
MEDDLEEFINENSIFDAIECITDIDKNQKQEIKKKKCNTGLEGLEHMSCGYIWSQRERLNQMSHSHTFYRKFLCI